MSDYNLGTASGRIEISGRGAQVGFKVAQTAAGAFFSVVDAKVKSVQTLGRRMAAVGASGTIGFGAAIKTAADFEAKISGVGAVVNGTTEEMEALRQKALDLGADTVYSASEAAVAIEELAKAGIPVEDILNGAAEGAVNLAAAGGVGLEEAAVIASNAMNQFGLGADKVTEVADILAGVANTSAADVSSLGQSLSQAGAVANLAGLSFRDTAIALGEMADAGINGSDAGTSLKTMLNNLIPTTDRQSSAFKELGLLEYDLAEANRTLQKEGLKTAGSMEQAKNIAAKYLEELDKGKVGTMKNAKAVDALFMKQGGLNNQFFDAKGNVKDLAGLQGTLGKALKGMTREQKLASLELLFGADAMRATAILSLAGRKGYKEFSDAVSKTKASDVAAARLNNLNGAVEAFKGSMETAMISIGSVFLPVITKIVKGLTMLVNGFNSLPGPVKTVIAILAAITSAGMLVVGMILAMLPLILAWVANFLLMRSVSIVVSSLRVLWASLRTGQGVMAASQLATTRLTTGFMTLGKRSLTAAGLMYKAGRLMALAWTLMTGPVGIAIAVIAALVAIGVLLYKKWEPFRNLVDNIGAAIQGAFQASMEAIIPVLKEALAALVEFGGYLVDTLGPVVKQVGGILAGALLEAWAEIGTAVREELMPALREFAAMFQGEILPALQQLGTAIAPIAQVIGTVLVGAFLLWLTVLRTVYGFLISNILPIFIKVFGVYLLLMIKNVTAFATTIIGVFTGLVQMFQGFFQIIKGIFTGDWNMIWTGVKNVWKGTWKVITSVLRGAVQVLVNTVKALWSVIGGVVSAGAGKIKSLFQSAWSSIQSTTSSAMGRIKEAVSNGIKTILTLIGTLPSKALSALGNLGSYLYNAGVQLITGFANGITDKMGDAIGAVKDGLGKIGGMLPGSPIKWGPLVSWNKGGAGQRLMGFLTDGLEKGTGDAVRAAQTAAGAIAGSLADSTFVNSGAVRSLAPAAGTPYVTPVPASAVAGSAAAGVGRKNVASRLVSGTLAIDSSGYAFISGVAEDIVDDSGSASARRDRMDY